MLFALSPMAGLSRPALLLSLWLALPGSLLAQTQDASPFSDENAPQTYTSDNFVVHTDLEPQAARELLKRLETMLESVAKYFGHPNKKSIECFVVHDLKRWPRGTLPPEALTGIQKQGGVSFFRGIAVGGRLLTKARVYTVSTRGVSQHEAVHAYCSQTFGSTGPVWYAEGMAEMGHYWTPGDSSVNASPDVIEYLRTTPPKSLNEIVNGGELSGDSRQNYAWRWALCHLLVHNPNYQRRFRPLGVALLQQKQTSFEAVYGSMSDEIVFEYLLFLKNMQTGYRVDLCSWNWKARSKPATHKAIQARVKARSGWQPTRATLHKGKQYQFTTSGSWQLTKDGPALNANGDDAGTGRLVGVVFEDHTLSEEFEIGSAGKFEAPASGHLFVRCRDEWGALSDNDGEIELQIRKPQPAGTPFPSPRQK